MALREARLRHTGLVHEAETSDIVCSLADAREGKWEEEVDWAEKPQARTRVQEKCHQGILEVDDQKIV